MKNCIIIFIVFTSLSLKSQTEIIEYFPETDIVAYRGLVNESKDINEWVIYCKNGIPAYKIYVEKDSIDWTVFDIKTGHKLYRFNLKDKLEDSLAQTLKFKFFTKYLIGGNITTAKTCRDYIFPDLDFYTSEFFNNGTYTTYFNDSTIYYKMNIKNGKLNGAYLEQYDDGSIKIIGQFRDNNPSGIWKYYYKNGQLKEKGEYFKLLVYDNYVRENRTIDSNNKDEKPYKIGDYLVYPSRYKNDSIVIKSDYNEIEKILTDEELIDFKLNQNSDNLYSKYLFEYGKRTNINVIYPTKVFLRKGLWTKWDEQGNIISTVKYNKNGLKNDS